MRRFYITHNPDHDDKFLSALLDAGFIQTQNGNEAKFIVHDGVRRDVLRMIGNRPSFIIPHTPQSWFLWDGLCDVKPVQCNFVAGQAAVEGMKAYGYPYRVEAIGFPRCEVSEFRPSSGNDLLFIPSHAIENGTYAEPNYYEKVMRVFDFIVKNRGAFGKITMCWDAQNEYGLSEKLRRYGITYIPTNPYKDKSPLVNMMERMKRADLVISCGTAGCVSVALGKPTIFCTETGIPHTPPNRAAQHFDKYSHLIRHPNAIEKMTIESVIAAIRNESESARQWREGNIGGTFNAEKFISIIKEELSKAPLSPPIITDRRFQCPFCPSRNARQIGKHANFVRYKCVKCKKESIMRIG